MKSSYLIKGHCAAVGDRDPQMNEPEESQTLEDEIQSQSDPASSSAEPLAAPLPPSSLQVAEKGEFVDWLAQSGGALAVTTYTSGKLAVITAAGGKLDVACWKFARPMGLAVAGSRLAVVARSTIAVFGRSDVAGETTYQMQHAYDTGRIDAHDAAWGRRGLYFINTRFNCLARPSHRVRFLRSWQPRFVPGVVAGDACHLNGLGILEGKPAVVTAFCESDQLHGWKQDDRFSSGVVIDIASNTVVARGMCMPHSPRRHAGRWWLCNSGEGTLCQLDAPSGHWSDIALLPGFTRGLSFVRGAALVGLSRIRPKHILDAPPVRDRCGATVSGVAAIDLATSATIGFLEFVRGGREVYDVAFLTGVQSANFAARAYPDAMRTVRPA